MPIYDPNEDYTQHPDGNGNGGAAVAEIDMDNFELPEVAAVNKTAEQITKENAYPDVPPGRQRMVVTGFRQPELKYITVLVDGREESFSSYGVWVRLGLASNTRAEVQDFLLMPPANPTEVRAYTEGKDRAKPDGSKGWVASKFYHFVNAIGFDFKPGQPLPPEARRLGNWKGREVIADIKPGIGTRTDPKTGKVYENRPQPRLFKYERVGAAAPSVPGSFANAIRQPAVVQNGGSPAPMSAPSAAPTPAPSQSRPSGFPAENYAPQNRRAAVGPDDV